MESRGKAECYRRIRSLGKGGMSEVFEAEAPDGRHVALKVFRAEKSRRFLEERFLAEARLLSTLYHPRVVRVHDWGMDDGGGSPWYAMDLVLDAEGGVSTLEDVRRRGGADEARARRWLHDVSEALGYLHECGVVHRDVKLENILIDAEGRARLADFGVSRIIDGGLRSEVGVSTTFVTGETTEMRPVMGTYFYIPQRVRAGAAATPADDFYALGVAFFRFLTGIWYEPGTNALELLAPFGGFWRETLPRLLSGDEAPNRGAAAMGREIWSRRALKRMAWCALAAAVCVAVVLAGWRAIATSAGKGNGESARRAPPGVLWMASKEDLRGVDIGTVTALVVRAGMRRVAVNQFNGWPSLRHVVVDEGVESIGTTAFHGCSSLETVELPDSLRKIGDYAFSDCSALRHVKCGSGLRDVGQAAFGGCTNLHDVCFAGDAPAALGTRIYVRTPTNLVNHVRYGAKGWGEAWPPRDESARAVRSEP